jgi:hypothetical protein
MLSAGKMTCKPHEYKSSEAPALGLGPLLHKWSFKRVIDPDDRLTSLECADGQLNNFPESLAFCKLFTTPDLPSYLTLSPGLSDPFPPFYSRISKNSLARAARKVGIVVVATGKYSKFLSPFIASFRKFFLPKHAKVFYVFTNSWFFEQDHSDVVVFSQHSLGWPYNSLYRFHMALARIDQMDADYLFMADADLRVISVIDERILSELVAAIAPFYWGHPSVAFPYDRFPLSPAYMHQAEGSRYYFAGGFFGGSNIAVTALLRSCTDMADAMLEMTPAYVSPWHDESILNKFYHKIRKPTLIVGPEFLYPEPPFDKHMLSDHQKLYAKHMPALMLNLGVRKAGGDKDIRIPDTLVLRESGLSVIQHARPMKPFSCSAASSSESGMLCGMFALTPGTFTEALVHCSGIGMQLCSPKQLESLARAGYCSCGRAWVADERIPRSRPFVSDCQHCMKCGQFFRKYGGLHCSLTAFEKLGTNFADQSEDIVCCKALSIDELIFASKSFYHKE